MKTSFWPGPLLAVVTFATPVRSIGPTVSTPLYSAMTARVFEPAFPVPKLAVVVLGAFA